MTTNSNNSFIKKIDPIDALVEYINDVKPYHTKIVETNVSYVASDLAAVSTTETLTLQWAMSVVSSTNTSFIVAGNETLNLVVGTKVTIAGSSGNDGTYTVTNVVYSSPNTTITVTPSVPVTGSTGGTLTYTNKIV